jgi:hypothetical protein
MALRVRTLMMLVGRVVVFIGIELLGLLGC